MTKPRRYWAVCDDRGPVLFAGHWNYGGQYAIYPSQRVARLVAEHRGGGDYCVREVVVLELTKLKKEMEK